MTNGRNPFEGLERQLERLQRQFEDVARTWDLDQFGRPGSETRMPSVGVDLVDHGDEFELTADVPGFDSDDIDVRISDTTLNIVAEREEEDVEEREGLYLKSERSRKSISRSVRLPEPVDEDDATASYTNGVLTLTLPKREATDVRGRTIDVE